jgi:hypothetical protein
MANASESRPLALAPPLTWTQKAWMAINWAATHIDHSTALALMVAGLLYLVGS